MTALAGRDNRNITITITMAEHSCTNSVCKEGVISEERGCIPVTRASHNNTFVLRLSTDGMWPTKCRLEINEPTKSSLLVANRAAARLFSRAVTDCQVCQWNFHLYSSPWARHYVVTTPASDLSIRRKNRVTHVAVCWSDASLQVWWEQSEQSNNLWAVSSLEDNS